MCGVVYGDGWEGGVVYAGVDVCDVWCMREWMCVMCGVCGSGSDRRVVYAGVDLCDVWCMLE